MEAAGLEPATSLLEMKEPPSAQLADSTVKERDNRRDIDGCEATVRTRTSWFRARRGTSSTTSHWSGREGSNLQPPAPEAGALPLRHVQVVLTVGFEPTLTAV